MATYNTKPFTITRYEGNLSDFVAVMPELIDMTVHHIRFLARFKNNRLIMDKTSFDVERPGVTINGQTIRVEFLPQDTLHKAGEHLWEMDLLNTAMQPIAAFYGSFVITSQLQP